MHQSRRRKERRKEVQKKGEKVDLKADKLGMISLNPRRQLKDQEIKVILASIMILRSACPT